MVRSDNTNQLLTQKVLERALNVMVQRPAPALAEGTSCCSVKVPDAS